MQIYGHEVAAAVSLGFTPAMWRRLAAVLTEKGKHRDAEYARSKARES